MTVLMHSSCKIKREAVGIIELKGVSAGEHRLALGLMLLDHAVVDAQASVDGLVEVLLLHADDLGDIGLLFPQTLGTGRDNRQARLDADRIADPL